MYIHISSHDSLPRGDLESRPENLSANEFSHFERFDVDIGDCGIEGLKGLCDKGDVSRRQEQAGPS